jgi:hypothetical protein
MANQPILPPLTPLTPKNWQLDQTVMPADVNNWETEIVSLQNAINLVSAAFDPLVINTQLPSADGTSLSESGTVFSIKTGGVTPDKLSQAYLRITGDTMTGALQQPAPVPVSIAANTVTLPTTSNRFILSGTGPVNTINGFSGGEVEIRFNTAVTLTNSANLILANGGANRVTAVGDIGYYGFDSAGVVRETGYTAAIPVSSNPTGTLIHVLSKTIPFGYLKANGAAISRSVYANLVNNTFITIQTAGNKTSGSPTITNIPTTIDMAIGMAVEGAGIPAGSAISSINSLTSITLSANLTVTATAGAITVFPYGNGDGATTVNLPDLRGEHLRAWDDSRNADTTALTGTISNGSSTITGLSYTGFMFVGMSLSGVGIPVGATVSSITSLTSITISANATTTATVTLTFTGRRFGSFESDDFRAHNHNAITAGATSGSGGWVNGGSTSQNTYTQSTGGTETRGRNYAFPVYIKY